jgi:hypothetical protein
MSGRFEPAHAMLAFAGRLMGILCPIVQAFLLSMLDRRHDFRLGRPIAA